MDGAGPGQPCEMLSDGAVTRNFPIGRDLAERIEREQAVGQVTMRDRKRGARPAPAGPQQYIEIEHACAPSLPTPPAETPFDRLEMAKQLGRRQLRLDQGGGVGEDAQGRTDRRRFDYRRGRDRLKLLQHGVQYSGGQAISAVRSVRAEADRVKVAHFHRTAAFASNASASAGCFANAKLCQCGTSRSITRNRPNPSSWLHRFRLRRTAAMAVW